MRKTEIEGKRCLNGAYQPSYKYAYPLPLTPFFKCQNLFILVDSNLLSPTNRLGYFIRTLICVVTLAIVDKRNI